jgi:hypothetical protein
MYIFKLRDGELAIPEKFYGTFLDIEWFISNMIKYTDATDKDNNKIIEIYESKNAVLTLFDSIRFNKLTMYNESIDYIISLADYWCAPEWLQKELDEYKNKNSKSIVNCNKSLDNEPILQCKRCYQGFKKSENTHNSCKMHKFTLSYIGGTQVFSCCGRNKDEGPCIIGYHVT